MSKTSKAQLNTPEPPTRPNPLGIIANNESSPPAVLINGQAGVGKTSFAAHSEKPIFIITENGLGHLDVPHFPKCTKFEHVKDCVNRLIANEHEFKTLVLDSLDWTQELIFDFICRKYDCDTIEDANGGYGKGYTEALREWRKLLALIDVLRYQKNMAVIFTAHTEIRKVQDPRLPTYDSYAIKLNKRASSVLEEYADVILFATWDVTVREVKDGGQKRTRALEDAPRIMHTDLSPLYIAKNRYNLPPVLPLSWSAFNNALVASTKKKKEV